jgi:hypothetical protein
MDEEFIQYVQSALENSGDFNLYSKNGSYEIKIEKTLTDKNEPYILPGSFILNILYIYTRKKIENDTTNVDC